MVVKILMHLPKDRSSLRHERRAEKDHTLYAGIERLIDKGLHDLEAVGYAQGRQKIDALNILQRRSEGRGVEPVEEGLVRLGMAGSDASPHIARRELRGNTAPRFSGSPGKKDRFEHLVAPLF